MWEMGRSNEDRAVKAEEKNDCVFALWNISTPGSSGVMGVMACYDDFSTGLAIAYDAETYHDSGFCAHERSTVRNMVVLVF
jgi:hypothetical protein